ncbi:MAG: hypothetical protein NQU46_08080 [Methanolinea sp.]|nr:hypothetical protein [Methanolinea sp.]
MRPPRVPPMLSALVQSGVLAVDGHVFSRLDACPACGGRVSGYDTKERRFAVILDSGDKRPVNVWVRRYMCRDCGQVSPAEAPFYPETRLGSPIVDLCVVLSRSMTPGRAARVAEYLSLAIDRGTIRAYSRRCFPEIPVDTLFGFPIPRSLLSLSLMATSRQ